MYRRILTVFEHFKRARRLAQEETRRDRQAVSEPVLAFWRNHGREWASIEALPQDLEIVADLSERIHGLDIQGKQAEVLSAFQQVWRKGFSDPDSAFPWDGMNDRLSPAALVAFVEGVVTVLAEHRPKP